MKFEVRGGGFGYPRGQYILQNVNLSMGRPEVLPVLGTNGTGRTALLRCMLGLLGWKTRGTYIDGASIKEIPYHLLWQKIGYTPQAKTSTFAYRAEDMVLSGGSAHLGTFRQLKKEDMDIALACMEGIGISYLRGRLCGRISGGEPQVMLIARALAADPSILVLDEPEPSLDFRNQPIVLKTVKRLCREKSISAMVSTHYPEHALSISQKTLLLTLRGFTMLNPTEEVLSESHLDEAFGMEVKLYPLKRKDRTYTCILPVGLEEVMERGA